MKALVSNIFCKDCAIRFFRNCWIDLQSAWEADTKVYEISTSLLILAIGIALLIGGETFPPGESFSVLFLEGVTASQESWGIAFTGIGLIRLLTSLFATVVVRKWVTLLALYFWLLILFYLFKFGYFSIFVLFPFLWLTASSIFTFVSLWKRSHGPF